MRGLLVFVLVCVRFLRTQQRAKNRCQVWSWFCGVALLFGVVSWFRVFLWL